MSVVRNNWTEEEDHIIRTFVIDLGLKKWTKIAKTINEKREAHNRTGKQCRERWHNHLNPDIKKETWTAEEERKVFELQKQFGNKWSDIASMMPGRTDNSIKNCYYSTIRRNLRRYNKKRPDNERLKGSIKSLLKKPQIRAILIKESESETYQINIQEEVKPILIPENLDKYDVLNDLMCPSISPIANISYLGFPLTPGTTPSLISSSHKPAFFDFSERLDELNFACSYLHKEGDSSVEVYKSDCGSPTCLLGLSPNITQQMP